MLALKATENAGVESLEEGATPKIYGRLQQLEKTRKHLIQSLWKRTQVYKHLISVHVRLLFYRIIR